jgi:ParB-like chromosome segregation protein Spo0J
MSTTARKRFTADEIAAKLNRGNPVSASTNVSVGSIIRLSARRVRPYEHNPRTITNAKYAEMKESIRASGVQQIVTITKRPQQDFYITARGGNTRLSILHDLFTETQDPRFDDVDFILMPYVSERHLLASHLVENNQRSDLCFWDNARSILNLCDQIERDHGRALSLRDLSEALKADGVSASYTWLAIYRFAIANLSGLANAATKLTSKDITERIQPAFRRISKLATKLGIPDTDVVREIYAPEIEIARMRYEQDPSGDLDVTSLVDQFFSRFARIAEVERSDLDRLFHILDKQPELTAEDLRKLIQPQSLTLIQQPDLNPAQMDSAASSLSIAVLPSGEEPGDGDSDPIEQAPPASRIRAGESRIKIVDTPPLSSPVQRDEPTLSVDPAVEPQSSGRTHDILEARTPQSDGPRSDFERALSEFAAACDLTDCLRQCNALPLWYMVDIPELASDEPALDTQAANGNRPNRYYGWWWLVFISKQNTPAGLSLVPDSAFARICIDNETWEQACLEIIGEQVQPDQFYRLISAMCDPDDPVGPLYLNLIIALRQVRAAFPERFTPEFWIKQGVDPKFAEEV